MHPWRKRLDDWFTPIATRSPLSPTRITLLALGVNLLGAVALAAAAIDPRLFLVAPFVLAIGGLLDALDGLVARARNQTTLAGDLLDHFCDRVSDLAMMAAWCVGTAVRPWIGLLVVIAVALHGYAGTQIEATYGRRSYEGVGRGEFVLALVALPFFAYTLAQMEMLTRRFGPLSIPEWLTALFAVVALAGAVARIVGAVRTEPRS